MKKVDKTLLQMSIKSAKAQNQLEDKIAKEWYGCTFDELSEDDKELVVYEAADRLM